MIIQMRPDAYAREIYAISAYSIVDGFTALAWFWLSVVLLRFAVGLTLGEATPSPIIYANCGL